VSIGEAEASSSAPRCWYLELPPVARTRLIELSARALWGLSGAAALSVGQEGRGWRAGELAGELVGNVWWRSAMPEHLEGESELNWSEM
jgi:hypothetical protein